MVRKSIKNIAVLALLGALCAAPAFAYDAGIFMWSQRYCTNIAAPDSSIVTVPVYVTIPSGKNLQIINLQIEYSGYLTWHGYQLPSGSNASLGAFNPSTNLVPTYCSDGVARRGALVLLWPLYGGGVQGTNVKLLDLIFYAHSNYAAMPVKISCDPGTTYPRFEMYVEDNTSPYNGDTYYYGRPGGDFVISNCCVQVSNYDIDCLTPGACPGESGEYETCAHCPPEVTEGKAALDKTMWGKVKKLYE